MEITTIVVSTQHGEEATQEQIHKDIKKYVIEPVVPEELRGVHADGDRPGHPDGVGQLDLAAAGQTRSYHVFRYPAGNSLLAYEMLPSYLKGAFHIW